MTTETKVAATAATATAEVASYGTSRPNKAWICKQAPDFKDLDVLNADGSMGKISLSTYRGKWVLLYFYPLDFTFVCPTEIIAFSDAADQFAKLNVSIIGASCDSTFSHHAWTEMARAKGGIGRVAYPIIADVKHTLTFDYGVMHDDGHPIRGLFLIDPKGVLRHATLNDPPVGRNVDEALRVVQACQYADEHGEVCPAGWRPGKPTIKPSQAATYFAAANAAPAPAPST